MENVFLFNRPLRLNARSSNKDFNNNPNEPYVPENYVSESHLYRSSTWPQQPLPVPLFPPNSMNNNDFNNDHMNMNYSSSSHYPYDERSNGGPRFDRDRRKPNFYHPYNRNDQDHSNPKQRNGNYNHPRRGGGGGGGYNNYYR